MPEPSATNNNLTDLNQVKQALDFFKATGQVDPNIVNFVKDQVLPTYGLTKEEIDSLGPVEVMLRLEKSLSGSVNPTQTVNHTNQAQNPQTSPLQSEITKMEDRLISEIDEEIKRQLSDHQELNNLQNHVNNIASRPSATQAPINNIPPTKLSPQQEPTRNIPSSAETPLNESLDLKEGDKVGNDWILKRIYTTTFGNKQAPFYELQNNTGAIWTLNQDELRAVLRQKPLASKPQPTNTKPPEPTPSQKPSEIKLTDKQIAFLKKISAIPEEWEAATSITGSQWEYFLSLYKQGKLGEFGLNTDPLLDKLKNSQNSTQVTIKRGDHIQEILNAAGYQLKFSAEDSALLGLHLLLNYKLVSEAHQKIEASGLAVEPLPKEEIVESLIKNAFHGDTKAVSTLKNSLTFLPVENEFKILKPEVFQELEKSFL